MNSPVSHVSLLKKILKIKFLIVGLIFLLGFSSQPIETDAEGHEVEKVHPNDVSILYPLPETVNAAGSLISIAHLSSIVDGSAVFPEDDFIRILDIARSSGKVANRAIKFRPEIESFDAWKIAGIRFDPSAPGSSEKIIDAFGSRPQIRLVIQPVTIRGEQVEVHDVTIHVIYDYVLLSDPLDQSLSIADAEKMMAIIKDLIELRKICEEQGGETTGVLSVHPCLKESASNFHVGLVDFLRNHLHSSRFQGAAVMGLHGGSFEPWIFLALNRRPDGEFAAFPNPGLGAISTQSAPPAAQMISFLPLDSPKVQPLPSTTNILSITSDLGIPHDERRGISTAPLFGGVDRSAPVLIGVNSNGEEVHSEFLKNSDIVDWIANPEKSHFFNTDCISCHTETTRRLGLGIQASEFQFRPAAENLSLDPGLLHADQWNVRNFGWFVHPRSGIKQTTITQRTANETFEVVEFINERVLN